MVSSQTVLVLTVFCAFSFGLLIVLLCSMHHHLAAHLGLHERRFGNLWAAMNFVLVPFAVLAGLLIDLADVRWVIVGGSVCIATALVLFQSQAGYSRALFASILAAAGGGSIACGAMVLMPRAFFGSNEAAASLNMGNVFFVLGALIAPALADVLLRSAGLKKTLLVLAALSLVPGVLALCVSASDVPPAQELDLLALLLDPIVWVAGAVFFLYAPLEGCLHSWADSYLRGLGKEERDVRKLIAGFWSFFLVGRLLMAFMQHRRWLPDAADRWIVCLAALGATVWLGNLAGSVSSRNATIGFLMLGLFLGPIFPTLIGFLFSRYSNGLGSVFGVVFAIGSAGSLFFAPIISARMNHTSAQNAVRIPLVLSLLLMIGSLIFALLLIDPPR